MEKSEEDGLGGCHISLNGPLRFVTAEHQLPQQLLPRGHTYSGPSSPPNNNMENKLTPRQPSIATERNAEILYSDSSPPAIEGSWLERKLRPKKVSARYPIKGKALLFATCGFGSLGDALFGYNSGERTSTPV